MSEEDMLWTGKGWMSLSFLLKQAKKRMEGSCDCDQPGWHEPEIHWQLGNPDESGAEGKGK